VSLDSVDTVVHLSQSRNQRTVETRQRFGDDLEPTGLTYDKATRRIGLGVPIEVAEVGRLRADVLGLLPSSGPGKSETELLKDVAGDTGAKSKVLRELVLDGSVRREGKGVRGDSYRYSRAIPASVS
jgi:hypothetical protein